MCGIAGQLVLRRDQPEAELRQQAGRMASCLEHRGPDARGVWVDARAGVAFGHRRLAVVDVSPTGSQPMVSPDDRLVLSYNGEIYNHGRLRTRLEADGERFRGTSDTEVLLRAISRWGVTDALRAAEGMFALALWDRRERTLTLARDRLGEKPLYVGWAGDTLLFGSELRALRSSPHFRPVIDDQAVADLLRYSCIPAPRSIYRGVQKLRPGHLLEVRADTRPGSLVSSPYWDLAEVAAAGVAHPVVDEDEGLDELERLLKASVGDQMLADVPVGCFLSGGIDSSLVTALAQEQSAVPIRTFTIGFSEASWDEAPHARAVAQRLGTDHVEHYVSGGEALAVVPRLAEVYDEPFADSSQIPVLLVSQLARREVTVALSGDAGDELFAGYDRYRAHAQVAALVHRTPRRLRDAAARGLLAVPAARWDAVGSAVRGVVPQLRTPRPGERVHKLARLLGAASPEHLYDDFMSAWDRPSAVLRRQDASPRSSVTLPVGLDPIRQLQFHDQTRYLPDDLLVKVDRAAMSVSLETRVPMLAPAVVAHAWRMPTSALVGGGQGKLPLRRLLARRLPAEMVDRPKQGFAIPLGAWLRGPLEQWAQDLLSPGALEQDGMFRPDVVQQLLRQHQAGHVDTSARLWPVLTYQAWRQTAG